MFRKYLQLTFILALGVSMGCDSGGGGGGGGGSMSCTASDSVSLQLGLGEQNGECIQESTSFRSNTEVWGCGSWACVNDGDVLKFEWIRPNRTIRDTDRHTVSRSGPGPYDLAVNGFPDRTGQWSLRVYRNDDFSGSVAFAVN